MTVLGAVCKYWWNRYRWRHFKKSVDDWFRLQAVSDIDHPNTMGDDAWMVLVESMLIDSRFSPFEVQQLFDLAVVTAKAIVYARLV